MFNSASSQLMKFAQNRGDEINNLDRLLQMQMGLPQNAPAPLPETGPSGLPYGQATPNQLVTPEPIRPATFQRPQEIMAPAMERLFGQDEQPQQPQRGETPPAVYDTPPQGLQQPPPQHGPTLAYGGSSGVHEPHWPQQPQMEPNLDQPPVAPRPDYYNYRRSAATPKLAYAHQIEETARAINADPLDLATLISYETGGTFDPRQPGPTTKWGQHRGFLQWGEPQARDYGVDWNNPIDSQLGANGAIARYFIDRGYRPGMSVYDLYSTVNAGSPGRYNASDAAAGGAPGSVVDKVNSRQWQQHREKAARMMGYELGGAGRDGEWSMSSSAAPTGATGRGGQGGTAPFDRGPSVSIPEPQAPMTDAEYDRRLAALEEMAQNATPQRMTNREQFSRENFDLGGALRGFGLGLGQMSRGQPVDLGDVYNAQERRANTELELRLDQNRRTAASQMALEMGDPESAAAIAQGGIDFGQFLTSRQMEQVEARAMRNEMRDEIGRNAIFDYLAPQLGEEAARAAMYDPSSVLGFEQIMEANRRAEVARGEQMQVYQGQIEAARRALANPEVTPTAAWAAEQVLASGGQITMKDAMNIAGDEYDRFAPPEPEADPTSVREYRFDMSQRPPEQQISYNEWRNQGSGESAAEAEISRLMETGLTREQAIYVRDRNRVDPAGGSVIDTATGNRVFEPFRPTVAPIEGPRLYEQAELATGIGASISAFGTNVGGQIPIAEALFSDDNPNIMAARNIILAQNDLARALALNPKYPVGEIERIINEVGIKPGALKSSQGLRAAMQVTDTYMRNKYFEELAIANDPTATRDEAAAARQTAQSLARFIARLGVPNENGVITPAGTVTLPKNEAEAEAAYNALLPGDYYVSPDGKLRQKGS